jgi:hypothetical protein
VTDWVPPFEKRGEGDFLIPLNTPQACCGDRYWNPWLQLIEMTMMMAYSSEDSMAYYSDR